MTPREELEELRRLEELDRRAALKAPEKGVMDHLADWVPDDVKNIGTALYKGAASTAAGAMDALAGSHDITDIGSVAAGKPVRTVDTTMPNSRALEASGYQPKTGTEKYIAAAGKGVGAALTNPGSAISAPIRAAVVGGASGAGAHAGSEVFKGTPLAGPAAFVGGLLGGGLAGLGSQSVMNTKDLAQIAVKGIKPDEFTRAGNVMKAAETAGIPINLDQALGRDTNVTNILNTLATRNEGQKIVNQLRDQPSQISNLMQRMKRILPGQVQEPGVVANTSQQAATDVLTSAKQARTAATKPLFDAAGDVSPKLVEQMYARISGLAKANPDTNKGQLFEELASRLSNALERAKGQPTGILDAQGNPIMSAAKPINIGELNASLRSLQTNQKNIHMSSSAGDAEATKGLHKEVSAIRDALGAVSPSFKAANAKYQQISENVISPLKKSVIGRVAGISGALDDKEGVNKLLPILAKGRNPDSQTSDILNYALKTKSDPQVFQDAVKTHIMNAVSEAEKQMNGVMTQDMPKLLEQSLLGTPTKKQGLMDAIRGISLQRGDTSRDLERGFMNAMQLVGATAKRPSAIGPSEAAVNEVAGRSFIASGLKMVGLAVGKPAGQGMQRVITAGAYKTLAESLTDEKGIATLLKLAKTPIMSPKAQVILNTLLGTEAVAGNPPEVRKSTSGEESDPGDHEYR